MSKRKRHENVDSRLNHRAVDLFKLGKATLAAGIRHDSQEMNEVSLGLHRALGLRPWMEFVLDFESFTLTPTAGREKDFALVQELHRRLAEAAA